MFGISMILPFCLAFSVFGCIPTISPSDEDEVRDFPYSLPPAAACSAAGCVSVWVNPFTTPTSTRSTTSSTTSTTTTTTMLCPDEWIFFEFTQSCYFLGVDMGLTYPLAADYCVTQQSTLASIHSSEENAFIVGMTPYEDGHMAIGYKRIGMLPTDFDTYDGTPVGYTNWAATPDNRANVEYCVEMLLAVTARGLWNDLECNCIGPRPDCPPKYFVCKRPRL